MRGQFNSVHLIVLRRIFTVQLIVIFKICKRREIKC